MQERYSSWRLSWPAAAVAAVAGTIAIGQLQTRIETRIGRAPGSYMGSSNTIRYGDAYVGDKWSMQTRALPSEDRGARLRDGYLPSENRYYSMASGSLPVSGARYLSPPRGSVNYAYAPPPSLPSAGRASIRYGVATSASTAYAPTDELRRADTFTPLDRPSLASSATSYRSAGSIRYAGVSDLSATTPDVPTNINDLPLDRAKPIRRPLAPLLPDDKPSETEGVAEARETTESPAPPSDLTAPPSVRGPLGLMGLYRLPENQVEFMLKGRTYYRVGFTCYKPYVHDGKTFYVEISPPYGTVLPVLPPGCETVTVDSQTYHRSGTVYYRTDTSGDKTSYIVVEPPAGAPSPAGGPSPIALLQRMSDRLAQAESIAFEAAESAPQSRVATRSALAVHRPNRLRADVDRADGKIDLRYDGKTLGILDQKRKEYAVSAAPDSLDALLDQTSPGILAIIPFADLLRGNAYKALMAAVQPTSARYVDKTRIGDVECHHVAFDGDQTTCELWLEAGDRALPLRWQVVRKSSEGSGRYDVTFTKWRLSPKLADDQFDFKPPQDAKKIELEVILQAQRP
ncbi:MAG: DUF2092 domain-containing protein [Phycisphaerae bacterium]|nr:DUF2092 domain-containing protein [Phycisphaerae bacterium]